MSIAAAYPRPPVITILRVFAIGGIAALLAGCVKADSVTLSDGRHVIRASIPSVVYKAKTEQAVVDRANQLCPNGWDTLTDRIVPVGTGALTGDTIIAIEREVRCR